MITKNNKILIGICTIFSFVALILSVISFCSFEHYEYDKTSTLISTLTILVTILGIMVTLLIAWNIYSVVDIKNKIEKATELDKRINAATNEMEMKWQYDMISVSRVYEFTQDTTISERVFTFMLIFHNSRKNNSIIAIYFKQRFYDYIKNTFEQDDNSINKLAQDISEEQEISKDMILDIYSDYEKSTCKDKQEYKCVGDLLKQILCKI